MKRDRAKICKIISEMLDSPDDIGIYPTTEAYNKLERYVESVRGETLGWAYADACTHIDAIEDYRRVQVPSIYERMIKDLGGNREE